MASNNIYRQTGYFIRANTNGKSIIDEIKRDLKKDVDKLGKQLLQRVCEIFVEIAKNNLLASGYNVDNLVDNIVARPYGDNKYRIGIRNNSEKPIMYFLEFGTGVVGRDNPHPEASQIGWQYLMNQHKSKNGNPLNGWYYYDEERDEWVFTRGLKAVSYLYDTLQQMPQIIEQAKKEIGFNE